MSSHITAAPSAIALLLLGACSPRDSWVGTWSTENTEPGSRGCAETAGDTPADTADDNQLISLVVVEDDSAPGANATLLADFGRPAAATAEASCTPAPVEIDPFDMRTLDFDSVITCSDGATSTVGVVADYIDGWTKSVDLTLTSTDATCSLGLNPS